MIKPLPDMDESLPEPLLDDMLYVEPELEALPYMGYVEPELELKPLPDMS